VKTDKYLNSLIKANGLLYEKTASSLRSYFKHTWTILEPNLPLKYNWHYDLMAEYLMACSQGQIKRLIVNLPPRYGKSNLITVCFPTWLWIHKPELRFIFASYAQTLSTKHSVDRRTIIESDWYSQGYGHLYSLASDQNMKTEFLNNKRGVMTASSIHGAVTGKGGSYIIVDDPHNPRGADSDLKRDAVITSFDRAISTRLDDKDNGVIIVVMQRLHENDLSGHLIEQGGWEHLKLPGLFDKPKTYIFPVSHKTKQTDFNEPLHKERENLTQLMDQKKALGTYGWSGQYMQEPSPAGGGVFKRSWFKFWTKLPEKLDEMLISFDMAFKETSDSDFVVGQVWAKHGADSYLIGQVRDRMDFIGTLNAFVTFCGKYKDAHLKLVEEKANGAAVISALKKKISGIVPVIPKDSKEARAHAVSPQFESGNVYIPDPKSNPWVHDYIEEFIKFPRATHDDQVDATTQALLRFSSRPTGNFIDSSGKSGKSLVATMIGDNAW